MFIVRDVPTLVLIMFPLFLFRRCSGAEGREQSPGATQTDRHALRGLLPQTQGLQRRAGGAAVRRLGRPGLCREDFAVSLLNVLRHTTEKKTLYSTVSVFLCTSVSPHCLKKVLSAASPRSLTRLSAPHADKNAVATITIYCMYVPIHPLASVTYCYIQTAYCLRIFSQLATGPVFLIFFSFICPLEFIPSSTLLLY